MRAVLQPLKQDDPGLLPAVSAMSALTAAAPGLDDPRNALNPHHALYNELHRRIPDASENRLLQFTAACHQNKITADNLSMIHLNGDTGKIGFTGTSFLSTPAVLDLSTPSPQPRQSIQHIQQTDQHQAQIRAQVQAQMSQTNAQGHQGPVIGGQ